MEYLERKKKIVQYLEVYGMITSGEAQAITGVHRNTISSDLKKLVAERLLVSSGSGKGIKYELATHLIFSYEMMDAIFDPKANKSFDNYFKKKDRKKVFFNKTFEKALNADFSFPDEVQNQFNELKKKIEEKRHKLSIEERKRKKEKLVIDLSWASSNIEGNTYSILETEGLIKYNQTAKGKSFSEAQMILNHKESIEFIREEHHYKKLIKLNILELHQILTKSLQVKSGLREHLVAVSNSSYVPCDNSFQISSFLESIIEKVNKTESILEKVVQVNLLVSYLQPFSDGNKRTSRMLGNAILLSHSYIPVSFSHTAKEDYIKAILYFYEKQEASAFKNLMLKEINESFKKYVE